MEKIEQTHLLPVLTRIAEALEALASPKPRGADPLDKSMTAFLWHRFDSEDGWLEPIDAVNGVDLSLLVGVEPQRDSLLANTRQFAKGHSANNALLWGARGTGKSSLVKAIHRQVASEGNGELALIEINRDDLASLPNLLRLLNPLTTRRFILLCDDLSFEGPDVSYKSLKSVLEGGITGKPSHVILYATSNRRHLVSRQMIENEAQDALIPGEVVEEKLSLSDRFGLWLGFHNIDQDQYLAMIEAYIRFWQIEIAPEIWRAEALAWSVGRGGRSGRVAFHYMQDLAGRLGMSINLR